MLHIKTADCSAILFGVARNFPVSTFRAFVCTFSIQKVQCNYLRCAILASDPSGHSLLSAQCSGTQCNTVICVEGITTHLLCATQCTTICAEDKATDLNVQCSRVYTMHCRRPQCSVQCRSLSARECNCVGASVLTSSEPVVLLVAA